MKHYLPCEACGRKCMPRRGMPRRCGVCNAVLAKRDTRKAGRQHRVGLGRTAEDAAEVARRVELYAAMTAAGGIRYDDPRLWEGE